MRKFVSILLIVLPLGLFAAVLIDHLTLDTTLHRINAGQLADADLRRIDYLSIRGGNIAADGPYLPQRIGNYDYVPVFAATAPVGSEATPRFIAILPAGALGDRLNPPASADEAPSLDITGQRSAGCHDLAKAGFPAATAKLPCIVHDRHPAPLGTLLLGAAVILLPIIGVGLWLWPRRTPTGARRAASGCLVKLAKPLIAMLIVAAIAFGKVGDELWPAAGKLAPHGAGAVPDVVKVVDGLAAPHGGERFVLEAMNYGNKLASWKKNLDALALGADDTVEVQLIQLDARTTYHRDPLGAYRRSAASALVEHQLRRNGEVVGGQFFATDASDHWEAVALQQLVKDGPVDAVAELSVHTDKGVRRIRLRGEIEFLEGDAAAYLADRKVVFRYRAPALAQIADKREKLAQAVARNPRQQFHMANLLFEAEGDTLIIRSIGPSRRIFKP
ncbi:hypothetical protein [Denitromonas iodatirespirans]|uniref:Uncharacterized protein n=1 Tax=Denitromonas iodatirespirans TaxID=2795389 RepID=A0A944H6R5_DENI1|nr:hypothetical protein [Denitromonas iodatirespirans]MBT0960428.1 hypothetical protein [Denitromonas iodatirespirans]